MKTWGTAFVIANAGAVAAMDPAVFVTLVCVLIASGLGAWIAYRIAIHQAKQEIEDAFRQLSAELGKD